MVRTTSHDSRVGWFRAVRARLLHTSPPGLLRSVTSKLILAVHVDDIVEAGNSKDYEWLKKVLSKLFSVNNLGSLTRYTGCAFNHDADGRSIKTAQTAFIGKLIERFRIGCPPSRCWWIVSSCRGLEEEQTGDLPTDKLLELLSF